MYSEYKRWNDVGRLVVSVPHILPRFNLVAVSESCADVLLVLDGKIMMAAHRNGICRIAGHGKS